MHLPTDTSIPARPAEQMPLVLALHGMQWVCSFNGHSWILFWLGTSGFKGVEDEQDHIRRQ